MAKPRNRLPKRTLDLRRHRHGRVLLVCEETAEPHRGFCIDIASRREARERLPVLRYAVQNLWATTLPSRLDLGQMFDPVEADHG